jgi:hypothetical protein
VIPAFNEYDELSRVGMEIALGEYKVIACYITEA